MIDSRFATLSSLSTQLGTATVDESSSLVIVSILFSLIVIYLAAKLGGEFWVRIKLPPVLGELVGCVIVITNLAELRALILLFEIGLESEIKELLRVGPQATIVALVGVVVPFLLGTIGLVSFFNIPMIPAIFAGAALTATSIGITAKVLSELGQLQSKEGQIIIGAAVMDDILGIIILAVVTSLTKTGNVELPHLFYLIISAAIFLIGAVWLGRFLSPFFVLIVNQMQTRGQVLISALIIAFV